MYHKETYILAVDQGTSGTLASLYNLQGERVASAYVKVHSIFPYSGWVEQDPFELLDSIRTAFGRLVNQEELTPGQIICMGVANQGECLLLWDLEDGRPIYNMIGWQCVRSAELCQRMIEGGFEEDFRSRTGLPIHPEWPATKLPWILENVPKASELLKKGQLGFSQSDSWFIYQLTGQRNFLTDHSTASRSGFYNLTTQDWDTSLIELFHAENLVFPEIMDCAGIFGEVDFGDGWWIPWMGNALDQPAALLGQACIHHGEAKVTYGTCAGFWYNTDSSPDPAKRMDKSIAWQIDNTPTYAIVGETITAGAAIEWLKQKLHIPWENEELSDIAKSIAGSEVPIFIPALNGLGAPYWVPEARGVIFDISAGTGLEHLVRASLESIAYSVRDLLEEFARVESHTLPEEIVADGGMTSNDYLMQFQADILNKIILVPSNREGTSTGVAFLAGYTKGCYKQLSMLKKTFQTSRVYEPKISSGEREYLYTRWCEAVKHAISMYKH